VAGDGGAKVNLYNYNEFSNWSIWSIQQLSPFNHGLAGHAACKLCNEATFDP